jgi:hypothetical protein
MIYDLKIIVFKFSAFLALMTIFSISVNAQIVYTDIDDVTLDTDEAVYEVDLNNDGNFEIAFMSDDDGWDYWTARVISTSTASDAEINGWDSGTEMLLSMLNYEEVIDNSTRSPTFTWQLPIDTDNYITFLSTGNSYGSWVGANQKFAAVRFSIGADYHFGWVRLSVGPNSEYITIHDFAYNSVPNEEILAGETGSAAPLTVDFIANSIYVEIGEELTFYAQVYGGTEPYSYEWDFNNDGEIDATGGIESYSYLEEGVYSVSLIVTDADNTIETILKEDYITVYNPVGVYELNSTPFVTQSNNRLLIHKLNEDHFYKISVFNVKGSLVFSENIYRKTQFSITEDFTFGLYIIQIENENQLYKYKIIINQ